jgi:hypothetical protein
VPSDEGANAGQKVASLVAGMVAGADSIDDMGLLRHGGMGRVLYNPDSEVRHASCPPAAAGVLTASTRSISGDRWIEAWSRRNDSRETWDQTPQDTSWTDHLLAVGQSGHRTRAPHRSPCFWPLSRDVRTAPTGSPRRIQGRRSWATDANEEALEIPRGVQVTGDRVGSSVSGLRVSTTRARPGTYSFVSLWKGLPMRIC